MQSSKGQIGMIETIMVLVVVFIIIFVAIFFYYRFFLQSIEERSEELSMQQSTVLLGYIASMPELQCSVRFDDEDCIDVYELDIGYINNNREDYFPLFGFKNIMVEQVYPPGSTWQIYNNPKPNFESKEVISMPVSLDNGTDNTIGKLIVESYK